MLRKLSGELRKHRHLLDVVCLDPQELEPTPLQPSQRSRAISERRAVIDRPQSVASPSRSPTITGVWASRFAPSGSSALDFILGLAGTWIVSRSGSGLPMKLSQ